MIPFISNNVSDRGAIVEEGFPELNLGKEHFVGEEYFAINRYCSLEIDYEIPNHSALFNKATDCGAIKEKKFLEFN